MIYRPAQKRYDPEGGIPSGGGGDSYDHSDGAFGGSASAHVSFDAGSVDIQHVDVHQVNDGGSGNSPRTQFNNQKQRKKFQL